MAFRVDPSTLDGYASQVGRAADDTTEVKRYLDGYTIHGEWNGVLIMLVGDAHRHSMDAATATSDKIAKILRSSQEGLSAAASYYRHTDAASAARMDATLPGLCLGGVTGLEREWDGSSCPPSFRDSREPSANLKPVDDTRYSHPFSTLDYTSISSWALKGFDAVFGFNPLEKVTEFFMGDWQEVARAGVAIGNASNAMHDLGYNMQGGAISLRGGWEGIAADTAYGHFTSLANGVERMADPLRQVSQQFASIAHGVWSACEAVNGYVKGLIDAAIIAGIAAAAGTVTAETGIGAVVGYGVAAIEVTQMLRAWADATRVMNNLYASVQGGIGLIESQLSHLQGAELPDLSGYSAYRHPLAGS